MLHFRQIAVKHISQQRLFKLQSPQPAVILRNDCKRWRARIGFKGKWIHLGDFADEIRAAMAYDDKAVELFGEFAYLNFPERIGLRNWIRKIVWAA